MTRKVMVCAFVIGSMAAASSAFAAIHEVSIVDNEYVPPTLTVAIGDMIHWTNNGQNQHTVDSGENCVGDGEFDSGTLNPGDDFLYEVDEDDAGLTIPYFCDFHCMMGMVGSYTVEGETPTQATSWGKIKSIYR